MTVESYEQRLQRLEAHIKSLETELRGHRHNSFSGNYWLPYTLRRKLTGE